MSRLRLPARSALLVFTCLFALFVAELFLHLAHLPAFRYDLGAVTCDFDPKYLFHVTPGCTPEINSWGYRDYEFDEKRGNKKRIAMYGDSFLMGLNVRSNETIPKVLENLIANHYEVFNLGTVAY